jgi:spermidine/putrescine transport system substrate-binding protein
MAGGWDRWVYEYNTRRGFLRRAGFTTLMVGAGPTLLAACGDDDDDGGGGGTGASEGPAEAPQASGRVDFLSWEGYDIPDPLKSWKSENGVTVKATYIGNHDEIQTKLKAGGAGAGYDIITYYQGYKPLYQELEILEPLDEQKLPNLKNLFPYFASKEGNFWIDEDGTRTGVPWTWGSIGITIDTRRVKAMPTSWFDLLEPEFKGRVAIPDDPTGAWALGSHVLKFDPAETTKEDGEKVFDLLSQVAAQSTGVSPSFGDATTKMTAGDADVCWQGWAAMNQFAADAGVDTFETEVPKEGSFSFCDAYALPAGADNADTALAWMNESLDPKVNAEAAVFLVGGVTVTDAVKDLPKNIAGLYAYEDLDELLTRSPFYNNPPVESDEFVTFQEVQRRWQEIKSEAGA